MTTDARFVLDTSTTMSWCFEDEVDAYGDAVLDSLGDSPAVAPNLWVLEVTNVLLVGERRNRITKRESQEFIELLAELPIYLREPDSNRRGMLEILTMSRELALSSYDTAFLILAKELGLPLATRDTWLRQAAERIGVPHYNPVAT